jgi:hypothetical protein
MALRWANHYRRTGLTPRRWQAVSEQAACANPQWPRPQWAKDLHALMVGPAETPPAALVAGARGREAPDSRFGGSHGLRLAPGLPLRLWGVLDRDGPIPLAVVLPDSQVVQTHGSGDGFNRHRLGGLTAPAEVNQHPKPLNGFPSKRSFGGMPPGEGGGGRSRPRAEPRGAARSEASTASTASTGRRRRREAALMALGAEPPLARPAKDGSYFGAKSPEGRGLDIDGTNRNVLEPFASKQGQALWPSYRRSALVDQQAT